jgi:hypothetical protein
MEVSGQLHASAALSPVLIVEGWVGPRVSLDAVEKRKIVRCREWNRGHID